MQEIVVRPLDETLRSSRVLSGLTILGQGRVVPILDCGEVLRRVCRPAVTMPDALLRPGCAREHQPCHLMNTPARLPPPCRRLPPPGSPATACWLLRIRCWPALRRQCRLPRPRCKPYLTFYLQREEFGVPILRSREILRVGEITRIPEAPPHVRGVLNLRGRVVPVVEFRTRLGLPIVPLTPRARVIVVEAHDRLFGLLVDSVSRIAKIPPRRAGRG